MFGICWEGGASGAPCYGRNQIDRFCAVYLGSVKDNKDRWIANIDNHGIHVDHPHFAHAFRRIVLPDLINHQSEGLKAYLSKH